MCRSSNAQVRPYETVCIVFDKYIFQAGRLPPPPKFRRPCPCKYGKDVLYTYQLSIQLRTMHAKLFAFIFVQMRLICSLKNEQLYSTICAYISGILSPRFLVFFQTTAVRRRHAGNRKARGERREEEAKGGRETCNKRITLLHCTWGHGNMILDVCNAIRNRG